MIRRKGGVGGAARQADLGAGRVDDASVRSIALEDASDVSDVMRETGDYDVCVISWERRGEECSPLHNVMASQRHQHRVFDVVVKGITVANPLERKSGNRGNQFGQARVGRAKSMLHV